jgi:hypothetical protein
MCLDAGRIRGGSLAITVVVISFFFVIDVAFFSANLIKTLEGRCLLFRTRYLCCDKHVASRPNDIVERIADNPPLEAAWTDTQCE